MLYKSSCLVDSSLLSLLISYIGILVYNPKRKITKELIISILILTVLLTFINSYFSKIYIFILSYILNIVYYKLNYKTNINLSLYSTLILTLSIFISKFIFMFFSISRDFINTKLIILSFIIIFIFKNLIKKLIYNKTLNKRLAKINYILINIYPIYIISKSIIEKQLIQSTIIFIILSTVIFILITEEQKIDKYKILNKELVKLSKNNEKITTNYRKAHHEYKNKLIIIKSMTKPSNKELISYIDYLINESIEIKDKWLNELRYIPFPSIKNFINYKLNLLESKRAKIELFIGEEMANINPEKVDIININNINTIIGIMLDNIIEEIEKSNIKQVSINTYISNNSLQILLANTFSNELDLNKINTIGYSTKGKNRGIGLSLVNDIIKSNKDLELETKIEENFFIQHLTIKNIDKYLK